MAHLTGIGCFGLRPTIVGPATFNDRHMTNVEELIEDFQDLDESEACQLLDELGRELPEIPDSVRVDELLVPGCQSRVWLVAELEGTPKTGAVHITADSDAIVVKGLIFVAKEIFEGRTPREILDTDYQSVFDRMGVGRLITPQRKNGLNSVIRRIRMFAAKSLGEELDDNPASSSTQTKAVEPTLSIRDVRAKFPVLQQTLPNGKPIVYLDSGASARKPASVIA